MNALGRTNPIYSSGTTRPVADFFRRALYPAVLFAFAMVVFWKIVVTKDYTLLSYPDSARQTYAWLQFMAHSLHRHSFPFWDPYIFGGRSFIGELQTAAFYPLNLLLCLFPLDSRGLLPVFAIQASVVFHCFLASLFMFLLARELGLSRFSASVSGIAFAYSGSVAVRAFGQINIFDGAIWIPLALVVFLRALRSLNWKRQLLLVNLDGAVLGLCLLGGHHQPFILCGITVVLLAVLVAVVPRVHGHARRWLYPPTSIALLTGAVILFGFCYSAMQLLPGLEYSHRAYRWIGAHEPVLGNAKVPYWVAGEIGKLPPKGLLSLLSPYLVPEVENTPYSGVVPLILTLLTIPLIGNSRLVEMWWAIALLFLVLALGNATPIHRIFGYLVPGYGETRAPARNLLIFHLAVSFLAGVGAEILLSSRSQAIGAMRLRLTQIFAILSVMTLMIAAAGRIYYERIEPSARHLRPLFLTGMLLSATTLLFLARCRRMLSRRVMVPAILAVCLYDSYSLINIHIKAASAFDGKTNYEPIHYYKEDQILRFLSSQTGVFRIDFRDNTYPSNVGEVFGLDTMIGYGATAPKQFFDSLVAGGFISNKLDSLWNVRYIVSKDQLNLPLALSSAESRVYENTTYLPRAWVVTTVKIADNDERIQSIVFAQNTDLRRIGVVKRRPGAVELLGTLQSSTADTLDSAEVKYPHGRLNSFSVEVSSPEPALLIVSETWDPGWRARVNGQRAPVQLVDGALLGVYVKSGRSHIEFSYLPVHFLLGMGLAVVAAASALYCVASFVTKTG